MSKPPSNPYPYQSGTTQLWLCGRWGKGGVAILADGDRNARIRLGPTQFDVLATLVRAAADSEPVVEGWVPQGFLNPEELSRLLVRRAGGDPRQFWYEVDPKHVIKTVYRLRRRLGAALLAGKDGGRSWAGRFLEYVEPLGYRISTPPANLKLVLLDDPGGEDHA